MSYGESLLEKFIVLMIPHPFIKNYRPDWLRGLELDFYFPSANAGIEFQGDHHYRDVNFNGRDSELSSVRGRDYAKMKLCKANGVSLIRLDAVDLWQSRLRGKFKYVKHLSSRRMIKLNHSKLREIDREAAKYRRLLIKRFDSLTARTRRKRATMVGNQWWLAKSA